VNIEEEEHRSSKEDQPAERSLLQESIRVSTRTMDQFLNLAVELVIVRNQMLSLKNPLTNFELSQLREKKILGRIARSLPREHPGGPSGENDLEPLLNELMNERDRSEEAAETFSDPFRESLDVMDPLVTDIQQLVMETRMMPVSILFQRFPRSVRNFARELNKKVDLVVEGEDTRIDKRAIEELSDPLTHMLRNAIDHGIESAEERVKAGKSDTGTIRLRAFHDRDKVILEVADDGRGIHRDSVKMKAVQRGLLTHERAADLRDHEVYDLLFLPGFSTADLITELSGRGVGMDVVKRNVDGLNGSMEIKSEPGTGTTVRISLPRTLATTRAFLVRCGDHILAVPVFSVIQSLRVPPDAVQTVKGREAVYYGGEIIPAARLDATIFLQGTSPGKEEDKICLLLMKHGEKKIAFLVDEVLRVEEIVMKSLGSHLRRAPNISGSSILGTGEVALILDVARLFTTAQMKAGAINPKKHRPESREQERRRVLLVEDQMTTRLLEKSILEAAGFDVGTAEDGLTALNLLSEASFDLVVTDVQMPRMDGLSLTKKLKEDERFADLPVIIVTSLEREEDKRRGLEVGADAYLLKQSFNQGSLIQTIHRLLGPKPS